MHGRTFALASASYRRTPISNDSPPPLMVTLTPFGYMAPRSKGMCILQRYIEFLHSLPSAFPPILTLDNIYIYRH
jgi:hypothetical protein